MLMSKTKQWHAHVKNDKKRHAHVKNYRYWHDHWKLSYDIVWWKLSNRMVMTKIKQWHGPDEN